MVVLRRRVRPARCSCGAKYAQFLRKYPPGCIGSLQNRVFRTPDTVMLQGKTELARRQGRIGEAGCVTKLFAQAPSSAPSAQRWAMI
jgi:hypothetical protein